MDEFEFSSINAQGQEPTAEPMQVKLELLSPCKQLLIESRQLQTVAGILIEESKREINTAKLSVRLLNLQYRRLKDSS